MTAAGWLEGPLGLRDAAEALDISRRKLLRFVRDGLPVTRRSERVYIDVAEARDWIARNGTGVAHTAPALHPDDPRHAVRVFTARVEWLRLAIAAGHMIPLADVLARVEREWTETRSALLRMRHYPADAVHDGLAEALSNLTADDPGAWPTPRPLPPEPPGDLEEKKSPFRNDTVFAARYGANDPRHAASATKAFKAEAEYRDLAAQLVSLADVLAAAKEENDQIRRRVRKIRVDDLADEIHAALTELSETPEERLRRRMREVRIAVLGQEVQW